MLCSHLLNWWALLDCFGYFRYIAQLKKQQCLFPFGICLCVRFEVMRNTCPLCSLILCHNDFITVIQYYQSFSPSLTFTISPYSHTFPLSLWIRTVGMPVNAGTFLWSTLCTMEQSQWRTISPWQQTLWICVLFLELWKLEAAIILHNMIWWCQ